MEQNILHWMGSSAIGQAARESDWLFPACECLHFIGLSLLFGAVLLMDLRVLGFAKETPFTVFRTFSVVAGLGLAINLTSGLIMMCAVPANYWPNTIFKVKVLFIVLGVINALWFVAVEQRKLEALPLGAEPDTPQKAVAVMSLVFWTAVLIAGRFLPFLSKNSNG
jgi:hypothetical protein